MIDHDKTAQERERFKAWWDNPIASESMLKGMAWEGWQARAALDTGAVPEGWMLVPVEPTQEMFDAGMKHRAGHPCNVMDGYTAMLAVAPQPPASAVVDHEQQSVSSNDACVSRVSYNAASSSAGKEPARDRTIDHLEYTIDGLRCDLDSALDVLIRRINGEADLDSAANWLRLNYPGRSEQINSAPRHPASASAEPLGHFGHHPEPATDFCVEVEEIEGEAENIRVGFENGTPSRDELRSRIERAMEFRVGVDEGAVRAKDRLREIEAEFYAPASARAGRLLDGLEHNALPEGKTA